MSDLNEEDSAVVEAGWAWARAHNMVVGCRTFDAATQALRAALPTVALEGHLTDLRGRWHPEDTMIFVGLAARSGPRMMAVSRVARSSAGSGAGALLIFPDEPAVRDARARVTAAMERYHREGCPNRDPDEED